MRSGAEVCKSCRSRQALSNEYLLFTCKIWRRYSRERASQSLPKMSQKLETIKKNIGGPTAQLAALRPLPIPFVFRSLFFAAESFRRILRTSACAPRLFTGFFRGKRTNNSRLQTVQRSPLCRSRRELRPQERLVERHALEAVAHEEVRGEDRARGDVLLKNIYVVLTFF